ncbi:Oidioi.mRNA.OKI2018_I69.chr2.g4710.t1.cds [Oikopleura dioica]|uniref:Oidioi.mRNA.OKI2018_I69.chr2.g4710.t1.cds n=1 Tax=Oikopleura dioica TaxID=34765 RepID=A0ABN7SZS3_OIKDI|nr:Oidioi.mRNA.OKI2018_I69.chr2.g4710.t1.cds [Oikopleura dioica]
MNWVPNFCIYQALRITVVLTTCPLVLCGGSIGALTLTYPSLGITTISSGLLSCTLTILGLIGTLGSAKKSRYAVLAYSISLLLLCILEVVAGGFLYTRYELVTNFIEADMKESQKDDQILAKRFWSSFKVQNQCCLEEEFYKSCQQSCIDVQKALFNSMLPSLGSTVLIIFFYQLFSACAALCFFHFFMPSSYYKAQVSMRR